MTSSSEFSTELSEQTPLELARLLLAIPFEWLARRLHAAAARIRGRRLTLKLLGRLVWQAGDTLPTSEEKGCLSFCDGIIFVRKQGLRDRKGKRGERIYSRRFILIVCHYPFLASDHRAFSRMCPEVRGKRTAPSTPSSEYHIRRQPPRVLALFTVGDVYASLCKRGAYAPFCAQRRSRALFCL